MTEHAEQRTDEPVEQRVGRLTGDRLCLHCHYNLAGQTIVREPKYQLLIVRCPECGTVAPLQEYPALGRWSRRWAAAAAALLLLVIVGLWMANAGIMSGFNFAAGEVMTQDYSQYIAERYELDHPDSAANTNAFFNATVGNAPPAAITRPPGVQKTFYSWWIEQDKDQLFEDAGGWRGAIDWNGAIGPVFFAAVLALALGMVWSVAMIARSKFTLVGWAIVIGATALLFCSFQLSEWLSSPPMYEWQAGAYELGPAVMSAMLAFQVAMLIVGMFIGRPVARGLVRLLLPPRLWMTMHWLWTMRGLEPPRLPGS